MYIQKVSIKNEPIFGEDSANFVFENSGIPSSIESKDENVKLLFVNNDHYNRVSFLIGNNGSGKTSLFNCIAGKHPFDEDKLNENNLKLYYFVHGCNKIPPQNSPSHIHIFNDQKDENELLMFMLANKENEKIKAVEDKIDKKFVDSLFFVKVETGRLLIDGESLPQKKGLTFLDILQCYFQKSDKQDKIISILNGIIHSSVFSKQFGYTVFEESIGEGHIKLERFLNTYISTEPSKSFLEKYVELERGIIAANHDIVRLENDKELKKTLSLPFYYDDLGKEEISFLLLLSELGFISIEVVCQTDKKEDSKELRKLADKGYFTIIEKLNIDDFDLSEEEIKRQEEEFKEKQEAAIKSAQEELQKRVFPINLLSTGERMMLRLMLDFSLISSEDKDGTIILYEEPELSLHPSWQCELPTYIYEIIESYQLKHIHLIIATHSPLVVLRANKYKKTVIKVCKLIREEKKLVPIEDPQLYSIEQLNLDLFNAQYLTEKELMEKIYGNREWLNNRENLIVPFGNYLTQKEKIGKLFDQINNSSKETNPAES